MLLNLISIFHYLKLPKALLVTAGQPEQQVTGVQRVTLVQQVQLVTLDRPVRQVRVLLSKVVPQ